MITITESALYEIARLSREGFDIDVTQCDDGEPIIVMTDDEGLVTLLQ